MVKSGLTLAVAKSACKAIRDERSIAGMKIGECSHRAPRLGDYENMMPIYSSWNCLSRRRSHAPGFCCPHIGSRTGYTESDWRQL